MSSTIDYYNIDVECSKCGHITEVQGTMVQDNVSFEVDYYPESIECEKCGKLIHVRIP